MLAAVAARTLVKHCRSLKMKNKYLEQLHNLQYHKDATAEELRVAIEAMFRKDYFEDIAGNAKNKDEHIDECLLQDDLEDRERYLFKISRKEVNKDFNIPPY